MRNQNIWGPDAEQIRRQRPRGQRGWDGGRHGEFRDAGWGGPGRGGAPWGGPPPWVAQLFGPDWGGHRRGGRAKVRRGDVRTAILAVLADRPDDAEPVNGYQLIQQITEHSRGLWKPSPGSVYPTISQLVDEGLIDYAPTGRKALMLTDEGRDYAAEHADELAAVWTPFTSHTEDEEAAGFKQVIGQTIGAIVQVATTGTPDQRERAVAILADTRRRLYGVLAEGPDADDEDADDDGSDTGDDGTTDVHPAGPEHEEP